MPRGCLVRGKRCERQSVHPSSRFTARTTTLGREGCPERALGEKALRAHWTEGRTMTLEEANKLRPGRIGLTTPQSKI